MKEQRYNNTVGLMLAGMLFSSCMHIGMMGTGNGHHSGGTHEVTTDPVLEKEVIVGDVKAIGHFPALKFGEDVTLTLRLMDARTAAPMSAAEVYLHAEYMHRVTPDEQHPHPSNGRRETEHDINIDEQVMETSDPGVYAINYASEQEGEHTLMFHIAAIGDTKFEPELIIEARRMLAQQSHEHSGGMMGMSSTTTYIVVGAVVMGAIMIAMLAARGGMF